MKFSNKKIIGLIFFIVGVLLIGFSDMIPIPSIFVYVGGALLIAYGVINFLNIDF